jgi:hypothetical protein
VQAQQQAAAAAQQQQQAAAAAAQQKPLRAIAHTLLEGGLMDPAFYHALGQVRCVCGVLCCVLLLSCVPFACAVLWIV